MPKYSADEHYLDERIPAEKLLNTLELEVALLARAGFGSSAIAAALGLAPSTVKLVLRVVRWKLGRGWQRNPVYIWPKEAVVRGGGVSRDDAPTRGPQGCGAAGTFPEGTAWRKLKFTGLQRFWLKPVLDRLVERGALRLISADKEGSFAPPWLAVAYHRTSVRPAVYRVKNPDEVFLEMARFFQAELPRRAAEVMDAVAAAAALRSPRRQAHLPGADEISALLREAFGEAGERAAAGLKGRAAQACAGPDARF